MSQSSNKRDKLAHWGVGVCAIAITAIRQNKLQGQTQLLHLNCDKK